MPCLRIEDDIKISEQEESVRISVDITVREKSVQRKTLWYETEKKYRGYLYTDRIDMFLIAILPYCMVNGYDIQVSDKTGVSADLLYQLTKIMIPSLKDAAPFKQIKIDAVPVYKSLQAGTKIATGVSRGVDSFYTILKNMEGEFPLTHLTLFNVQGYGDYGGAAARKNFHRDIRKAQKVCRELNSVRKIAEGGYPLKLVTVDSNIQDELPLLVDFGGTFRDAGAILLLKQLFKIYYFAADTKLDTFAVQAAGRFSSPWLYYCLSTENYRIQLFGADIDRIDKVKYISQFPVTYDNLQVCRGPFLFGRNKLEYQYEKNCTFNCDKCRHTVLELIAAGKLEKYGKSFDLDLVQKKYPELLAEVVQKKEELFFKEIYQNFSEKGLLDAAPEWKNVTKNNENNVVPVNYEMKIIEILDCFLEKTLNKEFLSNQIMEMGYHTVAIYGMGRLGRRLYDELKNMVVYEIDRNKEAVYGNIPLKSPDEELPPVELIVITIERDIDEIRNALMQKTESKVITLRELLCH